MELSFYAETQVNSEAVAMPYLRQPGVPFRDLLATKSAC